MSRKELIVLTKPGLVTEDGVVLYTVTDGRELEVVEGRADTKLGGTPVSWVLTSVTEVSADSWVKKQSMEGRLCKVLSG